jgi:uncharacterized protein involved in exopolysaccharide biosynthesis
MTTSDRKLLALWILCAGAALVILSVNLLLTSNRFEARALVRCAWGVTNDTATAEGIDPRMILQIQVIRSRSILDQAFVRIEASPIHPAGGNGSEALDLDDMIVPQCIYGTNLISITARANDPVLAAVVANAVADTFAGRCQAESQKETVTVSNTCVAQLQELDQSISATKERLRSARQAAGETKEAGHGGASTQSAPNDDGKEIDLEVRFVQSSNLLGSLQALKPAERPDALSRVINDPTLNALVKELGDARVRLAALEASSRTTAADLAAQRQMVASFEDRTDARASQLLAGMSDHVQALRRDLLEAKTEHETRLHEASDRAAALLRTTDIEHELTELSLKRNELEQRMRADPTDATLPQVEVVEHASPAPPINPALSAAAWAAGASGLALTCASLMLLMRRELPNMANR